MNQHIAGIAGFGFLTTFFVNIDFNKLLSYLMKENISHDLSKQIKPKNVS